MIFKWLETEKEPHSGTSNFDHIKNTSKPKF